MENEIRRGDIYYISSNYKEEGSVQKAGRPAIIVSNNKCNAYSNVVELVYLTTQNKTDLPTHIDIRSATKPSIALCEQVHSIPKDRVGDYIGSCTELELTMINAALMISLDIDEERLPVERNKQEKEQPNVEVVKNDEDKSAIIKITTERNMYKEMYEKIIERVLVR